MGVPIFGVIGPTYCRIKTLPDVARHCQTLTDYRKSRWRPPIPEMEIQIERIEPSTRFQRLPLHLRPCRTVVCETADADRRWLVSGIQYGGHHFRFRWPPSWISVVLTTSDKVDRIISMSGMVENMGVEVGIAAPSITVEKWFPLPV